MNTEENDKLKDIAQRVLNKIPKDDSEDFGFVITILMIISITLTLIRVIQECNKSKLNNFSQDEKYAYYSGQIREKTIRRSWFTKRSIKKIIRKELPKEVYQKYGAALTEAVLDTGETLTDEDIITLVEAANV